MILKITRIRAIQNRLHDPPTSDEMGLLFETWLIRELQRLRDYHNKPHEFSFWREDKHEIDLLISNGHGPILAIECKTGRDLINSPTLNTFRTRFPKVPLVVASLQDKIPRSLDTGIEILPWLQVIELYKSL